MQQLPSQIAETRRAADRRTAQPRRRIPGRILLAALAASALLLTAGCASQDQQSSRSGWEQPQLPANLPRVDASYTAPIDAYRLTREESANTQKALAEIAAACMEDYGFSNLFQSGDFLENRFPELMYSAQPYGTLTVSQAKQYAYSSPKGDYGNRGNGFYLGSITNFDVSYPIDSPESDAVDPDPLQEARLMAAFYGPSQAQYMDANGNAQKLSKEQMPVDADGKLPPAQGCRGVAIASGGEAPDELDDVHYATVDLALSDKNFAPAEEAWRKCMDAKGYKLKSVLDASLQGRGISEQSIAIAVADAECIEQSRWPDTFYALLTDYQKQAIAKEPERFTKALEHAREFMNAVVLKAGAAKND